ncbi:MAG: hypothetical protein MUO85_07510 [candidate division Zixibacteria bacterium]|nr:hypothetical protein [candidate division Zixibacteria bacterium]
MDEIRFSLNDDEHAEFAWFAREYPRIFRYHLYHAEHRLKKIHDNYRLASARFQTDILSGKENLFSVSMGRGLAWLIYWDFEAFLNAINSSLDIMARLVGLFYADQLPLSFNKLCSRAELEGPVDLLRAAQRRWVARMKDYRDCFVHYTPVDNESFVQCHKYADGWEVRCKIPINPNVRESDGFRFSRRVDLIRYALATYRNLRALDRKIGQSIRTYWRSGRFPKRRHNLFFAGSRQKNSYRPNKTLQHDV